MEKKFDPDPPECFSQVMGAAYSDMFLARAKTLRAAGRDTEADDATALSLMYSGFRRLVR